MDLLIVTPLNEIYATIGNNVLSSVVNTIHVNLKVFGLAAKYPDAQPRQVVIVRERTGVGAEGAHEFRSHPTGKQENGFAVRRCIVFVRLAKCLNRMLKS